MKVFAPVLIPTLNRHDHLKKCLESLSRCTWAEQTEVYVALDYPPMEKYVEGWKKNKEFLENCGNMGFKKLHLIERAENYGTWLPGDKGNLACLAKEIRENYDRYIITEDDNVFSPNFLEYMNKGFDLFKEDDSVYALCGYRHYVNVKYGENTYFRQNVDVCAWGLGAWTNKKMPKLDYKGFRSMLSLRSVIKIYRRAGVEKAIYFINCCNNRWNGQVIDIVQTIYYILKDKYVIMPTVSLVKNIGMDNSGVNFLNMSESAVKRYEDQEMSVMSHFDYIGDGFEFFEENQKIYKNEYPNKLSRTRAIKTLIKALVKVVIYR